MFEIGRKVWFENAKALKNTFVRYYSRKSAVNVRKINPKVPTQEAYSIAQSLYDLIKQKGPLSIPNTWIHAQEAGISGLQSKTHMKIMLKWMRGRRMLKLLCNHVGSSKKFLHTTLPEDHPQTEQSGSPLEIKPQTKEPSLKMAKTHVKKNDKKCGSFFSYVLCPHFDDAKHDGKQKLIFNHVGSSKKFLPTTLPEDPQTEQSGRRLRSLR